jgi:radical SAM superfamily enzyme YgiQ (UPF0313 family)
LVNPTGGWEQKKDERYFFPIGLLYLQNYLLKNDIPSTIIDVRPQGLSPQNFKSLVEQYNPKIIGFTGSPFERHTLLQYMVGLKEYTPNALVIGGGPYFTATAKDCLIHLSDVDIIVRGEGELTLLDLVKNIASGRNFRNISGITYRDESGEIVENPDRPPANRDECEINMNFIRDDKIYNAFVYLKNFERENIRALPILLARGCVKHCTFCFNNSNGRFRSRSIESVIEEIEAKREKFNCDYFWMVDPTFTIRETFALELCVAIRKHCPGIKWYCETRADTSLKLLNEMAKAGCISIDFALESGSPKVLKAIRKDLDVSCVVDFARECKKLGMRCLVFVMYSMPEETYNEFLMTIDLLSKIKPFIYDISISQTLILPGTQLEIQARTLNLLPADFSWYDSAFEDVPSWESEMNPEEILRCQNVLRCYRYSLQHSRILSLGNKLRMAVESSFLRNGVLVKNIRKFPRLNDILSASMDSIFGIDR